MAAVIFISPGNASLLRQPLRGKGQCLLRAYRGTNTQLCGLEACRAHGDGGCVVGTAGGMRAEEHLPRCGRGLKAGEKKQCVGESA